MSLSELVKRFEYPLPAISSDTSSIQFDTSGLYDGQFTLTNTGGSVLEGTITSNLRGLTFSPAKFSGNNIPVIYSFSADRCKKGDLIQTSILIVSNGGEIVLPVTIRITAPSLRSDDTKVCMSSLDDFAAYAMENFSAAARIFSSIDFRKWLKDLGYENMSIYEMFNTDSNIECGLDNFLILNDLKKKAVIDIISERVQVNSRPLESDPLTCVIPIELKGWGYVDERLKVTGNPTWIKLMQYTISQSDFRRHDQKAVCGVSCLIYPKLISLRSATAEIQFLKMGKRAYIDVRKLPEIEASLSRQSFTFDDSGHIIVKNFTFLDLPLDILTDAPFIRFEARRYIINSNSITEIPFVIRFGSMRSFKKRPSVTAVISLKTFVNDRLITKRLTLAAGVLQIDR